MDHPRRRRTRDLVATRTPETWTLAGLFVGASLACLLGAMFPLSSDTPVLLSYTCAAITAALAALLWLFGDAVGRVLLSGSVILGVFLTSVIVATAATPQ